MDEIERALDERIMKDLKALNEKDFKPEERKEAIEQLSKIYRLRLDEKQIDNENESRNWGRKLKMGLEVAGIAIPNGVVVWSIIKTFQEDAKGIIPSQTTRRVIGWIKPQKLLKIFKL